MILFSNPISELDHFQCRMAWLNSGINFTLPGNGGPECMDYHSTEQKLLQTGLVSVLASFAFSIEKGSIIHDARNISFGANNLFELTVVKK